MAVTARFVADFSSFNQAVDRAVQKLGLFEKSTEGVEKSLNRMVDSFSGQKIVREATIAAEAVEAIGGKSKLTQDELERVGRLAQQAAEKLRLMGQDVPPKMQALADAVEKPNAAMSVWHDTIKKVGATLVATFSVGAIISAIKNTGQWAGEIQDLSTKLGISAESVQRLDFAARQSGSSMDQVGNAIALLSKNLVEGDGAAVPALERLGLSFESLKALSPDEAFKRVGVALADLPSDVERLATAQQLLGRSGADLLPMFETLEEDMRRAVVASDAMIKAGDSLGDSWDSLMGTGKALLAGVLIPFAPALDKAARKAAEFANEMFILAEARKRVSEELLKEARGEIPTSPAGPEERLKDMVDRIRREENLKRAQSELSLPAVTGGFQGRSITGIEEQMKRVSALADSTGTAAKRAAKSQDDWTESLLKSKEGMTFMVGRFGRDLPAAITATAVSIEADLVPALQQSEAMLAKMMTAIPAAISSQGASAGVGGGKGMFGGLFGGIQGGLSGMLKDFTGGQGISGIFSKIGTGLFEGFGNILSGGLSSLINSGIGLLGKGLGKLFGGLFGGEGKKVNDMRDQFIAAAGGIDVLAAKAQAAGTSVDKLLAAKKVKDFEKAVQDLEGTLGRFADQTEKDQLRLQEAIEKYGFTLAELGPMLQKQKLDTQATDLAEDWRVLMAAGVDVNAINERMEESVMAYLDAAKSVGAEVPASMRPVLQSMIDTGTLTDEAGKAFESLDAAGITFASTLTDVVDKLDELIDKLGELGSMPNINVGMPTIPEGGFAGGTGGRYLNFGRGTPVMLHGRERVSTEAEGRAEASGLSSLAASMDAIRRDFATFPELMRDALQTRVVVAH